MRRHGIPVNVIAADAEIARARVFDDHNYHIYTGTWTTWKLPTHNHFLYHTNYNRALGSNYVHGFENDGVTPNHPALNDFLNQIYYSETLDGAWTATQQAMGRFVDLVVTIPLWSDRSYAAWSSDLLGIVNMDGYGPINPYTFMNARKFDGSPIRIGAVAEPDAMNIIFSTGISDYVNLDRMNMYGVFETPPYSLAVDQPGWVQNWEVNTWFDGGDGEVKTMVRKSFRDDASFVEPETGGQTMDVDASNYFFSAWYEFAVTDSWHYSSWQDVHHINVDSPLVDVLSAVSVIEFSSRVQEGEEVIRPIQLLELLVSRSVKNVLTMGNISGVRQLYGGDGEPGVRRSETEEAHQTLLALHSTVK